VKEFLAPGDAAAREQSGRNNHSLCAVCCGPWGKGARPTVGVGDACAKAGDGFGGDTELAVLVDMRGRPAFRPDSALRRRCKGPGLQASTQHDDRFGRLDDIVRDPGLGSGFEEWRTGKPRSKQRQDGRVLRDNLDENGDN